MCELSHMARPGSTLVVRVTPKAARNSLQVEDGLIRIHVTAAPERGKANAAVQKQLAKALGVAKSRLVLVRGETTRTKLFRID
ncbi:DUF167 domain-containing protein [Paracoccus tegillarcae]|uniref:UPF0235 protein CUV01_14655 n=1 Tax=Paracoccus tegillarcae TaxID=1529068 RepID=A0A2K9EHL9_9RHOB|nr:DUF167 domain-containing protein [Paracoccus tegillarcae]AUH34460.1 hypothetical protein CUV01_14655 [Paracoccus tegillarcae]